MFSNVTACRRVRSSHSAASSRGSAKTATHHFHTYRHIHMQNKQNASTQRDTSQARMGDRQRRRKSGKLSSLPPQVQNLLLYLFPHPDPKHTACVYQLLPCRLWAFTGMCHYTAAIQV